MHIFALHKILSLNGVWIYGGMGHAELEYHEHGELLYM